MKIERIFTCLVLFTVFLLLDQRVMPGDETAIDASDKKKMEDLLEKVKLPMSKEKILALTKMTSHKGRDIKYNAGLTKVRIKGSAKRKKKQIEKYEKKKAIPFRIWAESQITNPKKNNKLESNYKGKVAIYAIDVENESLALKTSESLRKLCPS